MWFTSLHAIRGLAALAVLSLHGYWTWPLAFNPAVRSMYLCVDLFFVLSGFVICLTYGSFFKGAMELGKFMRKRVVRLAPVYFVTGLFWLLAFSTLYAVKHTPISITDAMLAATRYAFALDYLYSDEQFKINPVAWSIMVELGAYLVFAGLWTLITSARYRLVLAAAMAVVGMIWLGHNSVSLNLVVGVGALIRCLTGFFVGVTICITMQMGGRRGLSWLVACLAAGLICANRASVQLDLQILLILSMAILLLVMWDAQIKVPRPLILLGDISYSLYMWHFVISVAVAKGLFAISHATPLLIHDGERFVAVPLVVGTIAFFSYALLSVGCAYLSYRILERKNLSFKLPFTRQGRSIP